MAAFSSDALRLNAAMLCPLQMSSSWSVEEATDATGGVAALEHEICGGGELPLPLPELPPPPPPMALPPDVAPLLQYVIIVSPAKDKSELG